MFKNKNGAAIPIVLMVFAVLIILGIAMLQIALSDTKMANWQGNRVQAHYLSRSGIYHGINILNTKLDSEDYTDTIPVLANQLNALVPNGIDNLKIFTWDDIGNYTIQFESTGFSGEIKITSSGSTIGHNPASSTITYIKKLDTGLKLTPTGDAWVDGQRNLGQDVDTINDSFLGEAVLFESLNTNQALHSPKTKNSIYQASIIYISENDGLSMDFTDNSDAAVLDAEIIYFSGTINLADKNAPIVLLVSDDVLNQRTTDKYDNSYPNPSSADWQLDFMEYENTDGFEMLERYQAFTKSASPIILPVDDGNNYGIVHLKGINNKDGTPAIWDVDKLSDETYTNDYYYFPNNVDLFDELGRKSLIAIPDDDPIVKILDDLFKTTPGDEPGLWNNE